MFTCWRKMLIWWVLYIWCLLREGNVRRFLSSWGWCCVVWCIITSVPEEPVFPSSRQNDKLMWQKWYRYREREGQKWNFEWILALYRVTFQGQSEWANILYPILLIPIDLLTAPVLVLPFSMSISFFFSILSLFIYPEAGAIRFLWNISNYLQTRYHHIPEGKTDMFVSIQVLMINEMARRQKETYLSYTFTFVV